MPALARACGFFPGLEPSPGRVPIARVLVGLRVADPGAAGHRDEGLDERATRRVRDVIVSAGRMVDAVPAAARRAPLQPGKLRVQPRDVEQLYASAVEARQ